MSKQVPPLYLLSVNRAFEDNLAYCRITINLDQKTGITGLRDECGLKRAKKAKNGVFVPDNPG